MGEGFSGSTVKDTWTKPRWGGCKGGRLGLAGVGESGGRKMQTTVIEQ